MAKKKEATKSGRPEGRLVPKEIRIKLTAQQCAQRSDAAAKLSREKTDLRKEFEEEEKAWKQKRAEYKNRIKSLEDQADKLLADNGDDTDKAIEDEIAQLQVKLDQLPEQITRIQTAYTRGEFDVKALQVQQARIQQERDELSAQIATLTAELEAPIDWFALELEDVSRVAAQQQAAHVLETKDLDYFTWDEFRRFVEEYDLGMELHETEYFLLSRIKGLLTPPGDARQAPKRLRIRRPLVR